ncbi:MULTISPECIES: hypothetical protein [Sorangium]|uniref:hypothetical protein n=1 Tax=Sorangium TaxID=39643 RepID=UPI003D9C3DDE
MDQLALPLKVAISKEIDGIDMGVLEDGTPYLTGRSLAKLCGAAVSTIINQAAQWHDGKRDNKFAKLLTSQGFAREHLYIQTTLNGTTVHAYPDDVCMWFLEYYALDSDRPNDVARDNYRRLARYSLREFIYRSTGYDPSRRVPEAWTKFHDRLMLNHTPRGYFSVFREMSDMVLTAIQNGLVVDEHTIPDISVGQAWSKHWKDRAMDGTYGPSLEYPHTYPDYFPQAAANAFIKAKIYPLGALGEFRIWMQSTYLPSRFPKYLDGKVAKGALPASAAELILSAFDDSDDELPAGASARRLPTSM